MEARAVLGVQSGADDAAMARKCLGNEVFSVIGERWGRSKLSRPAIIQEASHLRGEERG